MYVILDSEITKDHASSQQTSLYDSTIHKHEYILIYLFLYMYIYIYFK